MNGSLRGRWLIDILVGTIAMTVVIKGGSEAFTDDHVSWPLSLLIGGALAFGVVTGWYALGGRSDE